MALKKNDVITLDITGTTAEGNGVGKYEGMAVFVPASAEGDRLSVKILKVNKSYAYGKIETVLFPSPHRLKNDCPVFPQCGGCVFRHITYAEELRVKEQRVKDALQRIGGFSDIPLFPIVGAEQPDHYRNKAQLPIGPGSQGGKLSMGFFAPRSHRIVDCAQCRLQPLVFSQIAASVRAWAEENGISPYVESTGQGCLRHLYLRQAKSTGKVMACLVVNGNGIPGEERLASYLTARHPALDSIVINSNREKTNVILGKKCRTLWGKSGITDTLCGLQFHISPLSFYQVNHDQAQRLYQLAAEYAGLTGTELLLDLYCGTGTIGLSMAGQAKKLIGVEIIEEAVANARQNAIVNKVHNCEFYCADAAKAAALLASRREYPDVVILDPPRKGCDGELIPIVAQQMHPQRIVYVSCDPATLARDLRQFSSLGYAFVKATPVDMFPRTAHVETCVLLSHKNS